MMSLLLVLAWGCSGTAVEDDTSGGDAGSDGDTPTVETSIHCEGSFSTDAEDHTVPIPAPPAGGLQIKLPCIETPPHEDRIYCFFGTYEGPTAGVNYFAPYQSEQSHHNQIMAIPASDSREDGVLYECTDWEDVRGYEPMFENVGYTQVEEGEVSDTPNWLELPPGFAFKIEAGTRYMVEAHYINPIDVPIAVNDGMNMNFIAEEDVDQYVSTYHFDAGVEIPPGGEHTACMQCQVPADTYLFSMNGHMHGYGQSFTVDLTRDGATERIYEVPLWSSDWTYDPKDIITSWDVGEYQLKAGDQVEHCCTWVNPTESTLRFPDEMCTLLGVAYPLQEPWKCP